MISLALRGAKKKARSFASSQDDKIAKLVGYAKLSSTEGRKNALKLAIAMRQREWFEGLWNRSKNFDLPVKFSPIFSP